MEKVKQGVNYKATENLLDQLRSFIIERYCEVYHCSRDELGLGKEMNMDYDILLNMLEACYYQDNCVPF